MSCWWKDRLQSSLLLEAEDRAERTEHFWQWRAFFFFFKQKKRACRRGEAFSETLHRNNGCQWQEWERLGRRLYLDFRSCRWPSWRFDLLLRNTTTGGIKVLRSGSKRLIRSFITTPVHHGPVRSTFPSNSSVCPILRVCPGRPDSGAVGIQPSVSHRRGTPWHVMTIRAMDFYCFSSWNGDSPPYTSWKLFSSPSVKASFFFFFFSFPLHSHTRWFSKVLFSHRLLILLWWWCWKATIKRNRQLGSALWSLS